MLLESRYLPLFAAVLGAVLTSPSIFSGFATEDWVHRDLVKRGAFSLPYHLNMFGHGLEWTPAEVVRRNTAYQLDGFFPWVADRTFDTSFFRPIASITHQLDYREWPNLPWLMHLESILWYAALAAAVAVLHRRLVPERWVAGFAALLYAADDAHGHAVGWIINRNGVMATLFAVLALVSYDRFRREGSRGAALLTTIYLALGLCSAEFALCTVGYFVAYVLFVESAPLGRRLLGAIPWLVPLIGWSVAYRLLGHTTHGSGLYIDPVSDPTSYVFELFERGSVLLMGQFVAPFSDTWTRSGPYLQGLIVFWAAMVLWFMARVAWPVLSRNRMARFWAAGLVLSLPPACATFPEDRLLFACGIGAFPLIAIFLAETARAAASREVSKPRLALAGAWILLHAVVAPLLLPYRSLHMYRYDRAIEAAGDSAFATIRDPKRQSLIVVNAENYYFIGMMPLIRLSRGQPITPRMVALAGSLDPVTLTRIDDRRIEVTPKDGFLSREFDRIYRSRERPFTRGSLVDLLGVKITVTEVNQWGDPMSAIFDFALPLENPRYQWVVWEKGRYEPFVLPKIGSSVVVKGS